MGNIDRTGSKKEVSADEVPSVFKYITSEAAAGSDITSRSHADFTFNKGSEARRLHCSADAISMPTPNSVTQANDSNKSHSISISLPVSLSDFQMEHTKRVIFDDRTGLHAISGHSNHPIDNERRVKQLKIHQQSVHSGVSITHTTEVEEASDHMDIRRRNQLKNQHFDSFKTWSWQLEKKMLNLRRKPLEPEDVSDSQVTEPEAMPAVDRYFAALEGAELETLRPFEELLLPKDKKWPFLLRFPISSFGMCLGTSSQAMLWKTLATSPSTSFLHLSLNINLVLWWIALALMVCVSFLYILKIIVYFEAVRREYYHPVRVNFFFAPWIACLFLSIGLPPLVAENLDDALWYVLMAPILCLELKLYGQWMSGGQRRLSKVANPSNHLSIVGNFVGALLGASMGLKEGPMFFFAVGLAHYIVLFVTLYQRLPTNETLPKELHPVFFLFVAAPCMACMSWEKICGHFGYGSRIGYFIALFLYASLAVRVNFFRGYRFSLSWWAYTFPMTGASIASINYAVEVPNISSKAIAVVLSGISTLTVTTLLGSTLFHAFVLRDLFPNDISIAITERKAKACRKRAHLSTVRSDTSDIEACV